jgi:lipopolysaccharide transport system ATP-binding protein
MAAPKAGGHAATDWVGSANAPVIRVDRLSKCYHIYDRPQDRLKQALAPRVHRLLHPGGKTKAPAYYREFWALRDVSFEVFPGEAMAIIGRNGAGKSTLLQIIAGTLAQTSGSVQVHGRIAAMLELGSGFNPEFSGRENVYLNASLLGLTAKETQDRFDDIAAFADIGDFIDQPVKTYSSGMVVRLAFSVQTAVKPEVLIVDEALAVGDVFFQAKCMARLRRLASEGVTILFVTHDAATVRQMCDRAILLSQGRLVSSGTAVAVTDGYLRMELEERNRSAARAATSATLPGPQDDGRTAPEAAPTLGSEPAKESREFEASLALNAGETVQAGGRFARQTGLHVGRQEFEKRAEFNRTGNGTARFLNVQILKNNELSDTFDYGDAVRLRQVITFHRDLRNVNVAYKIRTIQGVDVVFGDTRLQNEMERTYLAGRTYVFDWAFRLNLMHGSYCVTSTIAHPPGPDHDDWIFVDVVPLCLDLRIAPRREGMIGGFVVWDNRLEIARVAPAADPSLLGEASPTAP